ncbi:MAG: TetR/AcrR family transcriptional regulator [Bacteroidales bacterium]|nr:TetR/AcrR family transcriptional regulator [Bacteroidales bacterium]
MGLTVKQRIKREQIIETARSVFKKSAYKKTTMIDIANASGNAKSSIYYYFKSKEEIFKSVILSEAIIYRNKVLSAINKTNNPQEKLKSYILIRLQTNKILSNFHNALRDPNLRHIKFVDKLKKLYDKEEYSIFRKILQSGVDTGYFQIYDIKNAAVGIVMAMRGIESTLLPNPHSTLSEEKAEGVLNIVLYGIVKR